MNFSSILSEIEKLDPEIYERTSQRRSVIKNWARNISLTAVPFALGSLFNKAYGKTNDQISDILQYALKLEYLESEFYYRAVAATVVDPPANQLIPTVTGLELPAIRRIWDHEKAHVNFIQSVLTGMQIDPNPSPKFDFTGGKGSGTGPFIQVFSDYGTFLAVAQTFEDTGVRAYKGQAVALKANNDVLTAAVRIHSTEARHAAHIRLMRSQTPGPLSDNQVIRPWITRNQSGINSPDVQKSYNGEENTAQAAMEIIGIAGMPITEDLATQAFDEPLTMLQVGEILEPFIVP